MLTTDRLNMVDNSGARRRIIPAEVTGYYHLWRGRVHFVLLLVFLSLPWIRVGETQAILLNFPRRHFEFFGKVFLAHDTPLIFLIAVIFGISIMLVTALWGRVWCGWACPQTVFIDSVFRRIEKMVEGNYRERRSLQSADLSLGKITKTLIKWFLFIAFSSVFSHSLIAYFTGGRELIDMLFHSPENNWSYFVIVSSVTALLAFNFGWFREQFCILMCPYGRFQGLLIDNQSYGVAYDVKRGEPRKGTDAVSSAKGDCVDCGRCVQVCPTGIDIRNGLQMECISCTACMDACDDIMKKIKKPEKLIAYRPTSLREKVNFFRPRVLIYILLLFLSTGSFVYGLSGRKGFAAVVLKTADFPYQLMTDGRVVNHFKIHLHNQSHALQKIRISPQNISDDMILTQGRPFTEVAPGETSEAHIFVTFPQKSLNKQGKLALQLLIEETESGVVQTVDISAVGPFQN